ncbi:MAG: hypothetical protein GF317_04625 [Candidatus Lokiarchaeota archaeon]|nr:hypothetical protein [Candidatus Lokiarchaeota archaeon]
MNKRNKASIYYRDKDTNELVYRKKSKRLKKAVNAIGNDKGRCNARLKKKDAYCSKAAGWGTDHLGYGRCKLHGGNSTGALTKNNMHKGILTYLGSFGKNEQEVFKKFIDDNTLEGEIAIAKTKLSQHLNFIKDLRAEKERVVASAIEDPEVVKEYGKRMVKSGRLSTELIEEIWNVTKYYERRIQLSEEAVQKYVDIISKMQQRNQSIKEGLRLVIDIRAVSEVIHKVSVIVNEEMRDNPARLRIADRIRNIGSVTAGHPDSKILEEGKDIKLVNQLNKINAEYEVLDAE